MSKSEEDTKILNESPDFDLQLKVLEEEKASRNKNRRFIILISSMIFLIATIFFIIYSTIYVYKKYEGEVSDNECENVNLKYDDSIVPNINIAKGDSCKPVLNIDYHNNRKPLFNLDLFGDETEIFNKTNQMDESNKFCVINCDANDDGWPDYNIDLNGDGVIDINIVLDPSKSKICDLNCDINNDMIPDINIDINNDKKPDINIDTNKDSIPDQNIDYKGNRLPVFNIEKDGIVTNSVNQVTENEVCLSNCDLDNDGWPDYNIYLNENSTIILNELIKTDNDYEPIIYYNKGKNIDWKCIVSPNLDICTNDKTSPSNEYINIDVNNDGNPDINISNDKGNNLQNPLNKETIINNETWVLNYDLNKDGFPDYNIDINNDNKPDINVTDNKTNLCIKNCDTNNDGIADYLISYPNTDLILSIRDINIDYDYDLICDVNCDNDYDLYPDINMDINKDNIPDLNIDFDHDKISDFNIDKDDDGIVDLNIDIYGIGVCNFNCLKDGLITKKVDNSNTCYKNCDTTGDGYPDNNVDVDDNGVCDFNCNNGQDKIDKDGNYFLDSDYDTEQTVFSVSEGDINNVFIMNPLDIKAYDIEPSWNGKYVLLIKNDTNYAVAYNIFWDKVYNDFTDLNNLNYFITRSNTAFMADLKAPRGNISLKDKILIKGKTTIKYVLDISFLETGVLQNEDSGKTFKGQLKIESIQD